MYMTEDGRSLKSHRHRDRTARVGTIETKKPPIKRERWKEGNVLRHDERYYNSPVGRLDARDVNNVYRGIVLMIAFYRLATNVAIGAIIAKKAKRYVGTKIRLYVPHLLTRLSSV